jgi:hypothetical protein
LQLASPSLQQDREIVLEAMRKEGHHSNICKFVGPSLLRRREFVLEAMVLNDEIMRHISDDLKDDEDLVLAALQSAYDNYVGPDWLSEQGCGYEQLTRNPSFMLRALEVCPYAISSVPETLLNQDEFVLRALKCKSDANFVMDFLDPERCNALLRQIVIESTATEPPTDHTTLIRTVEAIRRGDSLNAIRQIMQSTPSQGQVQLGSNRTNNDLARNPPLGRVCERVRRCSLM